MHAGPQIQRSTQLVAESAYVSIAGYEHADVIGLVTERSDLEFVQFLDAIAVVIVPDVKTLPCGHFQVDVFTPLFQA